MKRTRMQQDASTVAGDLFGLEIDSSPGSGSHTMRQGDTPDALRAMSKAFRSLETFRTLTWMRIERGEAEEAVKVFRDWEGAVRATREEYEKLTG